MDWSGVSDGMQHVHGFAEGTVSDHRFQRRSEKISTKLKYTAEPDFGPAYGTQTCLLEPGFGVPDHNAQAPAPGTVVYAPPAPEEWRAGPWPQNQKNVVPGRLFVREADGKACFEFSYPYG